jgi:hypothetical protein
MVVYDPVMTLLNKNTAIGLKCSRYPSYSDWYMIALTCMPMQLCEHGSITVVCVEIF